MSAESIRLLLIGLAVLFLAWEARTSRKKRSEAAPQHDESNPILNDEDAKITASSRLPGIEKLGEYFWYAGLLCGAIVMVVMMAPGGFRYTDLVLRVAGALIASAFVITIVVSFMKGRRDARKR